MKVKAHKDAWQMARHLDRSKPAKVYSTAVLHTVGDRTDVLSLLVVANNPGQACRQLLADCLLEGKKTNSKPQAIAVADVEFPEQTPIEVLTACEGPKEFINRQTGTRHTTQPAEDTYAHFAPRPASPGGMSAERVAEHGLAVERLAKKSSLISDGLGWMLYPENHQDGCPFPGDVLKDCTCKPGACIG